ncbi:6-hydroxymethylpterin diphosphokinase MptE-like protein [Sporosarcina sp. FSL K6-1522]|uniref:motility associated factor glycosyltransferase family protein n=1 Tax=Sporosarcina sp. FSL K6-1522 TaxID=2921554 RepID=UPI00315B21BE
MNITIIETKTVPTVQLQYKGKQITFHSKYDPLNEAKRWAQVELELVELDYGITILGLGAGHHMLEVAQLHPNLDIHVIEFNEQYYNWFMNSPFAHKLKIFDNISISVIDSLSKEQQQKLFSQEYTNNVLIHKSVFDILPPRFMPIETTLKDIQMKQKSIRRQIDNMHANFDKNRLLNDKGIADLHYQWHEQPAILVSAGPSLHKQLPLLKKIQEESTVPICAVGTAVKPLLQAGIMPDIIVIIDPNIGTFNQLTTLDLPKTPLFYLSTAYHDTIQLHTGPRRILFQKGFDKAISLAEQQKEPLTNSGGSVATALLDLLVHFGANPIALVGQDLAYTNNLSHTDGAHAQKDISGSLTVLDYYQKEQVTTERNLNSYRRWFENYAKQHTHVQFFNCTEGGAYIANLKHISLADFYEMYPAKR